MTKKKPDFLRDLDTAIMDELTGGGIKGNAAGLVGTLTQIKEIKQLCGLPFCGYMAKLETVRPSGVPDEVTVVFAEDVPYKACNGIEFDVMQEFVEGSRLLLTGKVQTLKDFQSGRLLVYILADFVAVSEKAVEQDEAAVTVSYTHLRAHETDSYLVCRLLLEKKKKTKNIRRRYSSRDAI